MPGAPRTDPGGRFFRTGLLPITRRSLPVGLLWGEGEGQVIFHPDQAVTGAIRTVFEKFSVNANTHREAALRRCTDVVLGDRFLNGDGAARGFGRAGELDQESVAGGFDFAPGVPWK